MDLRKVNIEQVLDYDSKRSTEKKRICVVKKQPVLIYGEEERTADDVVYDVNSLFDGDMDGLEIINKTTIGLTNEEYFDIIVLDNCIFDVNIPIFLLETSLNCIKENGLLIIVEKKVKYPGFYSLLCDMDIERFNVLGYYKDENNFNVWMIERKEGSNENLCFAILEYYLNLWNIRVADFYINMNKKFFQSVIKDYHSKRNVYIDCSNALLSMCVVLLCSDGVEKIVNIENFSLEDYKMMQDLKKTIMDPKIRFTIDEITVNKSIANLDLNSRYVNDKNY